MKREVSSANRKMRLCQLIEKSVDVAADIHVDATQLLFELKTIQIEVQDYAQINEKLHTKLMQSVSVMNDTIRKAEDDIENVRQRLERVIKFFDKEFERQIRNRDNRNQDGQTSME